MSRKNLLLMATLFCCVLLIPAASNISIAAAGTYDDFPTRNIEFIIGWGPGGGTDLFVRTINVDVREILGGNIIEHNMPGGSSVVAMQHVLQQPADGYTIFGITNDIILNTLLGRTEMSYRDLMPIIRAHVDIGAFHVANAHARFTTFDEFVEYARANPGRVTLAGIGYQSNDHFLSFYALRQMGIEVTYVPYESASDMLAALLGGHVDMMYEEPGIVIESLRAGTITPILFFTDEQVAAFPDVPTLGQLGYSIPPYMWRGVAVRAGTPDGIVQKLIDAYVKAWHGERYTEFARDRLLDLTDGLLTGHDFLESMSRDTEIMIGIMEDLGYR